MKFCQLCGNLMKIENKRWSCSCGNFEYAKEHTILEKQKKERPSVAVLYSEINALAVINHVCTNCGFEKAQLVSKGIFVSDEDEMTEYICGKCGHHDPEDGLKA